MIVADDGETIVNRIEKLLKEVNKTRVDMCRDLNLSVSTISSWKTRSTIPPADWALKISEYLGISVNYLITGQDELFPVEKRELLSAWDKLEQYEQEILLAEVKAVRDRTFRPCL